MLLEVKNLTVNYGTVQALNNISLEVNQGEIVTLIGPNGAGKSTTLKVISGLVDNTSGEINFQGKSIKNLSPDVLVKRGLSFVPDGRRVFITMTVMENLEMGGYIRNDKKKLRDSLEKVFELFPILRERQKQRAGTLSSGEQQMLAMGKALMLEPKLLMLDEPTLGLSPNFIETVFEKIKEINRNGTAVLLVEQNVRMALENAHKGYLFNIGKIALKGSGKNLLTNIEKVSQSLLGISLA